jgi:hypothetical protein
LTAYPEPIQRSAALGVYPVAYRITMADFIAACVAEENRVFELLEAATTLEDLELKNQPIWPAKPIGV